jgi:hypothetical protein
MTRLTAIVLAAAAALGVDQKAEQGPPAAQVAVTAELACLHCTFGQGDGCAACLRINDETPVLLEGKTAQQFMADRLDHKVVFIEGALSVNKDKRLVLTSDQGRMLTDADKGKVPEKGQARVVGTPCCGHCDLGLAEQCTLAVRNASNPVLLDGKLATECAEEGKAAQTVTVIGKLSIDKKGIVRLDATKVETKK